MCEIFSQPEKFSSCSLSVLVKPVSLEPELRAERPEVMRQAAPGSVHSLQSLRASLDTPALKGQDRLKIKVQKSVQREP